MDVRRVMIVEDSPMLAERLRELLGQRPDLSVWDLEDIDDWFTRVTFRLWPPGFQ